MHERFIVLFRIDTSGIALRYGRKPKETNNRTSTRNLLIGLSERVQIIRFDNNVKSALIIKILWIQFIHGTCAYYLKFTFLLTHTYSFIKDCFSIYLDQKFRTDIMSTCKTRYCSTFKSSPEMFPHKFNEQFCFRPVRKK